MAGILVQLLTAPMAILIDAASFVVSAVLLTRIQRPERRPIPGPTGSSPRHEIVEGLRYVAKNPILRSLAARDLTSWFFGNFFASLYALYCLRELGMSPALIGLSVAVGGVGSLLGSLSTLRLSQRLGVGRVILLSLAVTSVTPFLIPLAGGPLLLASGLIFASQLIGDVFHTSYDITSLSVRQGVTSAAFLGRVNSCMYLLVSGIGPFGALAGGLLAEAIGIRSALYVAAVGSALGGLWVVFSPVSRLTNLPR